MSGRAKAALQQVAASMFGTPNGEPLFGFESRVFVLPNTRLRRDASGNVVIASTARRWSWRKPCSDLP